MPKTDIHVKLTGEDGNIFNLIALVSRELKKHNHRELVTPLYHDVTSCHSYEEALGKISDYVIVE